MVATAVRDLPTTVDVDQASRHLELLHAGAPGHLSLNLLGSGRRERHCFALAADLADVPGATADGLQEVVDQRWNVYTSCATFAAVPERGRGTRADVLTVPGVWADLDVKPGFDGYPQTEIELVQLVERLHVGGLTPTLEVATGSGGRHLYWLVHRDERLDAKNGQWLLRMWLDLLRADAGFTVENVHDTTRILRLAGTVRWPKPDEVNVSPRRVELVSEGPRYHAAELRISAREAHRRAEDERQKFREARDSQAAELATQGVNVDAYATRVQVFNMRQDWADLLRPAGWVLHSDERGGSSRCRYWTRPGKSRDAGKSASTDYRRDDGSLANLMTIYSNDPGLAGLDETAAEGGHGLCSKWHFARTVTFGGDERALLGAIRRGGGGTLP